MERLKQYPRTYSLDARTRRALVASSSAPLALIIAVSVLKVAGLANKNLTPTQLLAVGFVFALFALFGSSSAHRRVVLYEDGIGVFGWFSSRRLNRSEILGRRMGKWRNGSYYIIVPVDKSARELRLPPLLHMDKDFFAWMKGIPRVD